MNPGEDFSRLSKIQTIWGGMFEKNRGETDETALGPSRNLVLRYTVPCTVTCWASSATKTRRPT